MITRVLVANRGEIARRVFETCRRLGIGTVAVYTDPDAGSPHVAEADVRVRLEGRNGYLDTGQLIAAAHKAGADAIHPGYGFLSENADFAESVQRAGLIWIGPPVAAAAVCGWCTIWHRCPPKSRRHSGKASPPSAIRRCSVNVIWPPVTISRSR